MQTSNDSLVLLPVLPVGLTLMVVVYLIQRLQVRLPLQRFFKITSIAMITLSVFLIGETLHTAIGIGLIQPIPIDVRLFDIEKARNPS